MFDTRRPNTGRFGGVPRLARLRATWLTAAVLSASTLGCDSRTEIEKQRDAAADAADREVLVAPTARLKRVAPLTLTDRAAWRGVLAWPHGCENAFQATHEGEDAGLSVHPIGPGLATVHVRCTVDRRPPSHVFLRFDERGSSPTVTLLHMPVLMSNDGSTVSTSNQSEVFGDATISADGRELSVLSVFRPEGDCGVWSRFGIGTEVPRRLAAAVKLPCPQPAGEPVVWTDGAAPPTWRPIP